MAKTEQQILNLKQQALDIRDTIIQAKGTMASVIKQIEDEKQNLINLGVNPNEVDEFITSKEKEIDEKYDSALQKIQKWNKEQK
jgi:uncharacterized protein YdcH (DUF465 family)